MATESQTRIIRLRRSGFQNNQIAALLGVTVAEVDEAIDGEFDLPDAGVTDWTALTLLNDWTSFGDIEVAYRIEGDHQLRFRGVADGRNETGGDGSAFAALTADIEPHIGRRAGLVTWNYGFGYAEGEFSITEDGIVIWHPGANLAFLEFAIGI